MAKRKAYKSEKRQKELKRLKKQEEKRQRRENKTDQTNGDPEMNIPTYTDVPESVEASEDADAPGNTDTAEELA